MPSAWEKLFPDKQPIVTFLTLRMPETWPKADSSKLNLFEAVNVVGRAMHGEAWTGEELFAISWTHSPQAEEAARVDSDRRQAERPEAPISIKSPSSTFRRDARPRGEHGQHVKLWHIEQGVRLRRAHVEREQAKWESNRLSIERLQSAVEWLTGECRDGRVRGFVRMQSGGALSEMRPDEWNVEMPVQRFLGEGGFNRLFPLGDTFKAFPVYIFLERESLGAAIAVFGRSPVPVPLADLERLSPYLRMAVRLALANGYVEGGNVDSLKVRKNFVRHAWPTTFPGVTPSDASITAVAKVIGFPDTAAIEQGIRANYGKKT